jgi:hypothetical protein
MKKKTAHHKLSHAHVSTIKHHSDEVSGFLVHAILYFLVNVGLFIYFYSHNVDLTLFYWVVVGWGVGLVAHALSVFGLLKFLHKEW